MSKDFMNNLNNELKPKQEEKPVNSQGVGLDGGLVFSIPPKSKDKPSTKSFNVTMDKVLVERLDKIAKRKGYSRNEVINYMCNFCIEHMQE